MITSRIHPVVDREVLAQVVCSEGSIFSCQQFRRIVAIALVFTVVDSNDAAESRTRGKDAVKWSRIIAALAKTWEWIVSRSFRSARSH
jgi:hypothetical protein